MFAPFTVSLIAVSAFAQPAAGCQPISILSFALGSTAPDVTGTAELEDFAGRAIRSLERIETIQVVGHSDRTGSQRSRQLVSTARARQVRYMLISYGLPEGIIVATGLGDRHPLFPTEDNVREPQNRRVELSISFKPTAELVGVRTGGEGAPIC